MTYKEFLMWCDNNPELSKFFPMGSVICSLAIGACSRQKFGKERLWEEVFRDVITDKVVVPYNEMMFKHNQQKAAMDSEINFKKMGLDRYEVLCALYNNSHPLGLGVLHFVPGDLPIEEAHKLLDEGMGYADYVKGRVIKVKLPEGCESFSPRLYDRDNGDGAAFRALTEYAKRKGV